MNILVVSGDWTTEPSSGGVQSSVCTLVDALSERHAVTVFTPRWSQRHLTHERIGPVEVYRRRLWGPNGRGLRAAKTLLVWLVELPGMLRDLRRVFREQQIEVIHLHQLQISQSMILVARLLGGPPYVGTFHGRDIRDYGRTPWVERLVVRQLVRHACGLTAVSDDVGEEVRKLFGSERQIHVIPNGVGALLPEAEATAQETLRSLPAKYFICVGRLYPLEDFPLKGQDLLIRAWSKLGPSYADVHLVIAGSDDGRAGYERLAQECGVGDRVHILGPLPRQRLFALMKRAMGMVTASRSEGNPMSVLEAGFFGLPIVASNIPAHAKTLEHEVDSLLVPLEDPESIARAVMRLVDDPELAGRLGASLRNRVQRGSSSRRMADSYVAAAYGPAVASTRA